MKVWILLALTIVSVASESCSGDNTSNCTITSCGSNGSLECVNNICTCTAACDPNDDLSRCRSQTTCINDFNNGVFQCTCAVSNLHCIDGFCHCGYPPN